MDLQNQMKEMQNRKAEEELIKRQKSLKMREYVLSQLVEDSSESNVSKDEIFANDLLSRKPNNMMTTETISLGFERSFSTPNNYAIKRSNLKKSFNNEDFNKNNQIGKQKKYRRHQILSNERCNDIIVEDNNKVMTRDLSVKT